MIICDLFVEKKFNSKINTSLEESENLFNKGEFKKSLETSINAINVIALFDLNIIMPP